MNNNLLLFTIFLFILSYSFASKLEQHEHQYKENDDVHVWVNTIGPYSNPSETYSYYKLPFCKPAEKNIKRPKSFGESLSGEDISSSLYQLKFKESTNEQEICTKTFDAKEIESLIKAIRNNYYFEFIIDDLPVRGFIGAIDPETSQPYLFLHLNFLNLYNGDRIIHSNITMDNHKILNLASDLDHIEAKFSYSVEWAETEVKYKDRLDLYQDSFFEQELEIHWLSVLNSFVLVLLLAGFVILILMRVLKADYVRYEKNNVEEPVEDYGWKLLHGDVFRVPGYDSVMSSLLGAGVQFFFMILGLLLGGIGGIFDLDRMGTSEQVGVFLYALTSVLGGFFSATVYSKLKGKTWHWNLILTACIFSVPLFVIAESINLVAWYYGTSSKFSYGTIILILMIWLFIGFPLTIIGGIAGKRLMSGELVPPTKVSNFTREIPEVAWYRKKEVQFILSGFLPFSAIYIELYYIFESVWGYKAYTLFGILMIVFVILLVVTSCVSITMTYFQLSLEDWKWGWWSFFNGASTGIFIFAYSIFYYVYKSSMTGLLQTLYFFGYMFLACYFFFILLGTVSFLSSFLFVYHIYSNIKVD